MNEHETRSKIAKKQIQDCSFPAELFSCSSESVSYTFNDKILKEVTEKENSCQALRIIKNNRLGFSAGSTETPFEKVMNSAQNMSEFGQEAPFDFAEGDGNEQCWTNIDPEIEKKSNKDLMEHGRELTERFSQEKSEYVNTVNVSKSMQTIRVITSQGVDRTHTRNNFSLSFSLEKTIHGDITNYGYKFMRLPKPDELEKAYEETDTFLSLSETVSKLPGGKYPVIFHPFSIYLILTPLIDAFTASNVYNKTSPLMDKLEEQVLSPHFTLIDDPLWENGSRSLPFDHEGILTQTRPILEKGILKSFINNLEYAGRLKVKPSGNATRASLGGLDCKAPPVSYISNMIINSGQDPIDDLLKDIKQGLFLYNSYDCWQGSTINGDFSGTVSNGFVVENGKLTGKVKDMRISGNIYQLFGEQLQGVSQERKPLRDFCLSPYFFCKDVTLS